MTAGHCHPVGVPITMSANVRPAVSMHEADSVQRMVSETGYSPTCVRNVSGWCLGDTAVRLTVSSDRRLPRQQMPRHCLGHDQGERRTSSCSRIGALTACVARRAKSSPLCAPQLPLLITVMPQRHCLRRPVWHLGTLSQSPRSTG